MTPDEFKKIHLKLGWTCTGMAKYLGKCSQSISNYRCGRQQIPKSVIIMLDHAIAWASDRADEEFERFPVPAQDPEPSPHV